MTNVAKPGVLPACPHFSSGPTAKRPGFSLEKLETAALGRSHRSGDAKKKLKAAIDRSKAILGIPDDYRVAIVPASDTGAVETRMWSMLGAKPVDVFAWESFGQDWVTDATKQLKLPDCETYGADYGALPDFSKARDDADIIFTWNGTTSGVRVPNADWIKPNPDRVVICDATSAAFAQNIEWAKLDVVTYSWQKCLGGEAAHGMLILSPNAVRRLETYTPDRALPKLFRMTKGGKLNEGIFIGETINTPSMLCVEDYLDALNWAKALGGLDVVYDPVGGEQFKAAFRACNPEARILAIGFASGEVPQIPANHLLVKNISVLGLYWGGYLRFRPQVISDSLATLFGWYAEGRLKPHVSHTLPLDQVEEGLELLRTRKSTGKVVITP